MAGTNGPTSLGGTPDTPNPEGGVPPSGEVAADAKRKGVAAEEPLRDKPSQDQNEDG